MTAFGEYVPDDIASTIKRRDFKDPTDLICVHGTQDPDILHDKAHTLGRNGGQENSLCYAIQGNIIDRQPQHGGNGVGYSEQISGTLTTKDRHAVIFENEKKWILRRLTPIECERLMGFPDNWTRIPQTVFKQNPRNKHFQRNRDQYEKQPDGSWIKYYPDAQRYQACGNSMAVPVMHWIGRRIKLYNDVVARLT